jgi:hypothetical protein
LELGCKFMTSVAVVSECNGPLLPNLGASFCRLEETLKVVDS